jgi:hypothetical protein
MVQYSKWLFISVLAMSTIWVTMGLLVPLYLGMDNAGKFGDSFGAANSLFQGLGFIALTFTIMLQIQNNRAANLQRIEESLNSYINAFETVQKDMQQKLIQRELDMFKEIEELSAEEMKDPYFNLLKEFFIADYSINTATPRLNSSFNMYFKFVNSVCYLIHNADVSRNEQKQLRMFLLNQFHESEIKMISYYYYLFYGIVNSTDSGFNCSTNIVKRSKLLEGDLFLSDDFARNNDPRKDYDTQLRTYKNIVALRRQQAS